MIFDDHDMIDDWNISAAWVERHPQRSRGGTSTSSAGWCRTGSTSTSATCRRTEIRPRRACLEAPRVDTPATDAACVEWALRVRGVHAGPGRLLVQLLPPARRRCPARRDRLPQRARARRPVRAGWSTTTSGHWIVDAVPSTDADHLLHRDVAADARARWAARSLQQWNEAVCDGAWGRWFVPLGEKIRRAIDLEDWAAFRISFSASSHSPRRRHADRHGTSRRNRVRVVGTFTSAIAHPSSPYLAPGADERDPPTVCSPIRNALTKHKHCDTVSLLVLAAWPPAASIRRPRCRCEVAAHHRLFHNTIALIEVASRM